MSSSAYQPFLISEFKTGIYTYLQPWIRPNDAFEPLVNAYIYRGTVNKRAGYSQFGNTLDDNNPVMGIIKRIDEATGDYSLLAATTANLYLYNAGTDSFNSLSVPSGFSGTINNFFNFTNWQPTDADSSITFMTNNVDPITQYDGTTVTQPSLYTDDAQTNTITKCLDVVVYKQRMLYILPTTSDRPGSPQNQTIIWSAITNANNVVLDVAGNGGSLTAPTGDIIQAVQFLRDVLVVFFSNSTWIFRFTGNQDDPFRWDKLNNSKSSNCPYGTIDYDERCTSLGSTGFIACDGVNVQRYDISTIDYYQTNMQELYYSQVFAQRYDNLNQGWMLYVSQANNFPLIGGIAPGSDAAVIYNFLENTWSTYKFSVPMTCLGSFYKQKGTTWAQLTETWDSADQPWDSYSEQKAAPILLAGDTTGHIWYMDDDSQNTDSGLPIVPDIVTTRWNPVLNTGEKVQFGYIDIYYEIVSTDPSNPVQVELLFYIDNSKESALKKTLTLDGPSNSQFAFKRIYINLIGEFVQMEIDQNNVPNPNANLRFNGFVLWVRSSGRLTGP